MDNILKVSCRLGSFRHRLSPGCTTWSTAEISSDSRPHHGDRKRCIVKDGVTSHAVCCHAPSLECHLLENISADKDEVNILFRLKCLKTFHQPFYPFTLPLFSCRSRCPVPLAGLWQIVVPSIRALPSWGQVLRETVAVSAVPQELMGQQASLSAVASDHQNKTPQVPTDPVAHHFGVHHPDVSLMQINVFNVVIFIFYQWL